MKSNNVQLGMGTGSGTLLSVLAFISSHDVLKTVVLAAIGAVVSFAVSWVLQKAAGVRKKPPD